MEKEALTRYEINRKVKALLTRFSVDLSLLQFSSTGETVYLYGKLQKEPKGDFKPTEIETMIQELSSIPQVKDLQFDVSNWNLTWEPGFLNISKKR